MTKDTRRDRPPMHEGGRAPFHSRHRTILLAVLGVVSGLLLVVVVWSAFLFHMLSSTQYAGAGWRFPSYVYADWMTLRAGAPASADAVAAELRTLDYRVVRGMPEEPGEVRLGGGEIVVALRPFHFPDGQRDGLTVRLTFHGGALRQILDVKTKHALPEVRLEPAKIAEFQGADRQQRAYVVLAQMPRNLQHAVVASEDRRFYKHGGLDLRGLMRAALRDVRAGGVVEGGSTLTQQTVKNVFLSRQRTMWRKVTEAALAILMEMRYSKDEILEIYLNQIYLGQWGSSSIGGVESAARFYFGKHVSDLTLPECALLAGLIPAPNLYSPHRRPEIARKRRDTVLRDMLAQQYITQAEYKRATASRLRVIPEPQLPPSKAPYFVDYVSEALAGQFSQKALSEQGLRVFTTLDHRLQDIADAAMRDGVQRAQQSVEWRGDTVHVAGALVVLEPGTGAVRCMIGGQERSMGQFNRAIAARRQPGSAFKPVVYTAAMDSPFRAGANVYTMASLVRDEPTTYTTRQGPWSPRNYENEYEGTVTLRRALYRSLNVATVNLSLRLGLPTVIQYAHLLGITSPLFPVMSLALGVAEVTPMELTNAYATLAAGGVRAEPFAVRAVLDRKGKTVYKAAPVTRSVLAPQTAFVVTTMLEDVILHGTGYPARSYGLTAPVAGKTGTTNDEVDAWFVGYTPSLVCGVWVGADRGGRLGLTGAAGALPIWATFMRDALRGRPVEDFVRPPGVEEVAIDAFTGLRARSECPKIVRGYFVAGTAPREYCDVDHWTNSLEEDFADSTSIGPGVDSTDDEEAPTKDEAGPARGSP